MEESNGEATRVSQPRTFLIGDIRGYTRFTVEHGDEPAAALSQTFHDIAGRVVADHGGSVVGTRGDEIVVVFDSGRSAIRAALLLQEQLRGGADPIPVGIGLDAGEAIRVGDDYRGSALNLAARLCSIASAGQVLASAGLIHVVGRIEGVRSEEIGLRDLKGFADPVGVLEVLPERQPKSAETADEMRSAKRPLPEAGFLGARPTGTLVAREREREDIDGRLETVWTGTGAVVLVSGEPGVGKTRLSQSIMLDASEEGFAIATGRCYVQQQAVPYFPFREALSSALRVAPDDIVSHVRTKLPYLARLVPDAGILEPPGAATRHEEQQRLHGAVVSFMCRLAEFCPVALLFDDLHWADSSSLELLQYLARQTRSHPVFILATYRDTDVDRDHPLQTVVVDLAREHLAHRLPLKALDRSETELLAETTLGGKISPDLVDLIYTRTNGNPFFSEELLQEMLSADRLEQGSDGWTLRFRLSLEVPETVRLVIGQRLRRFSPSTQLALSEASVLGQTFTFDELAQLTERDENDLDEGLEEATAAGLVKFLNNERYTFNHGLTQQALYSELSPRRRRRLHQRAAEIIESISNTGHFQRQAEIAWHLEEAGDEARAFEFALLAGDHAFHSWALLDAKVHYEMALRLAQGRDDRLSAAIVLEKLGGIMTTLIRYEQALELLLQSSSVYRDTGDVTARARVEAQIGRVYYAAGRATEGIQRLRLVMPELRGASDHGHAALHSVLGRLNLRIDLAGIDDDAQRLQRVMPEVEEGLKLIPDGLDHGLLAELQATRAFALTLHGDYSGALEAIDCARDEAIAGADLFGECVAEQLAGIAEMAKGLFGQALDHWEKALQLARRMGNQRQVGNSLLGRSTVALVCGEIPDESDQALDVIQRLSGLWTSVPSIPGLALWLTPDRLTAVSAVWEQCLRSVENNEIFGARRLMSNARTHFAAGRHEEARAACQEILSTRVEATQRWPVFLLMAEIHIAEREYDDAQRLIDQCQSTNPGNSLPLQTWEWQYLEQLLLRERSESSTGDLKWLIADAESLSYRTGIARAQTLASQDRLDGI